MGKEQEYLALRSEVRHFQSHCIHIALVCISVSGLILAYTMSQESKFTWTFLTPLFVLIPGLYMYIHQSSSALRLSTYLLMYHEKHHTELNFESIKHADRNRTSWSAFFLAIFHIQIVFCVFIYWERLLSVDFDNGLVHFGVMTFFLFVNACISIYLAYEGGELKKHEQYWQKQEGLFSKTPPAPTKRAPKPRLQTEQAEQTALGDLGVREDLDLGDMDLSDLAEKLKEQ